MTRQVTTTLIGPGRRMVFADRLFVGVIVRVHNGAWRWTMRPKSFSTFTSAAHFVENMTRGER